MQFYVGVSFDVFNLLALAVWVFSGYSSFLPQSKHMQTGVRLIGDSKLPVGVNVTMNGCSCSSALRYAGDLSRMYPSSCPMWAGSGSSLPLRRSQNKGYR